MVKINPEGAGTPSFNGVFRRPSAKKPESHQASLETLTCFPELKARVQAGWPSQRVADYIETTYPAEYAGLGMVKGAYGGRARGSLHPHRQLQDRFRPRRPARARAGHPVGSSAA